MILGQLIEELNVKKVYGSLDKEITGVCFDSRKAAPGAIFTAVKGTVSDGSEYIDAAIQAGATAVICSNIPDNPNPDVTYITVADTAEALGEVASAYYGKPSERMIVVGVTGTNGKTTIATLLYKLFKRLGHKTGLLSTVCNMIDDEEVPSTHTTPDPVELNALMAKMVERGCSRVFMEVSSHAIDQKRIAGLWFDGAIFTNLTRDHLDYHKTMEAYLKAKKSFFDNLPATAFALTNADDRNGIVMLQNTKANKYTYSVTSMADFKCKIKEHSFEGMLLSINNIEASLGFVGKFNAYNLTAVYGAAYLLQVKPQEIMVALSALSPVSGRFQKVTSPDGKLAIVDYAHTPDALENVIDTINDIRLENPKYGRLITVVGCGGNRDKGKRPIMAKTAAQKSDNVILTSDNPRFENPSDILKDMTAGLDEALMKKVLVIENREQAIKTARTIASANDIVLIAGKGHETYQDIQGVKHHFDDREIWGTGDVLMNTKCE
ncbi:MAG: UDP-N-acetylmuramoyl-L-alanyl-D-glutamate--2,6-diaminopimelate ligase [Paludibacteraceae bacterium]|nr:UDP-N-acetylmuramoyl-L-alanyl-D-glutamate--2,6-diaminopimelate ligase [Paludibacteraceae bacterium]